MAKEICVPAAGESVTEADIVTWHKEDGDYVEMDEPLLELETDKASMDLTAEAGGILKISVQEGTVKVGVVVGTIDDTVAKPVATTPATETVSATPAVASQQVVETAHYANNHPSPAAQKTLDEKGISTADIKGTGRDGRITKYDVAVATKPTPVASKATEKVAEQVSVSTVKTGERVVRREKLSRLRKTLLTRLVDAQQHTASLTTFNEVDMSAVMNIRKHHKEAFKEKYNVGLGFMSFFTKAVTIALQNWPLINATIDGDEIVYHDYCDVGVAVATPKGLVVPVIKNAENLSFAEIESTIKHYAFKGRDGKITLDDMSGGTFTITNGGTFGSMLSTPILNRPQSAILGMHNIVQRPTAVNGQVEIRPIMYLALTYDHRLIDGAEAVQFLVNIKQLLEDPTRLLIGM